MSREFDIIVKKDSIVGFSKEDGRLNFGIYKRKNGFYYVDDFSAGWISPDLDIFGAWSMAKSVGITKDEFERAFGKIPDRVEVDLEEFVSWFFIEGQLPVQIDASKVASLYMDVVNSIILYNFEKMLDMFPNYDEDLIKELVYDYFLYNTNITKLLDEADEIEIFEDILLPVYGDYIEFDKSKRKVIILDYDKFYDFNKKSYEDLLDAVYMYVGKKKNYSVKELEKYILDYFEELEELEKLKDDENFEE